MGGLKTEINKRIFGKKIAKNISKKDSKILKKLDKETGVS